MATGQWGDKRKPNSVQLGLNGFKTVVMKMNKRSQDENTREDLEEFAKGKKEAANTSRQWLPVLQPADGISDEEKANRQDGGGSHSRRWDGTTQVEQPASHQANQRLHERMMAE